MTGKEYGTEHRNLEGRKFIYEMMKIPAELSVGVILPYSQSVPY
jgi:hypothetical protein